jgi:hypothetical protein
MLEKYNYMKFKIAIPLFEIKITYLELEYVLIDLYFHLKYSERKQN